MRFTQGSKQDTECVGAMAKRYLKKPRARKARTGKFFFIDHRLYRIIRTNVPANLMEAWSYEDQKSVTMLYSDFRSLSKKAVTTKRAADILGISKKTLQKAYLKGNIDEPPVSNAIGSNSDFNYHWWGLEHILAAHDYFLSVHQGRPRKDGGIQPNQNLSTRAEIIARMTDQVILYSKEGDRFVPAYNPPKF